MITTGEATSGNLTKVQFAKVVNGSIVYDDGKNDHHVFGGKYEQIGEWLHYAHSHCTLGICSQFIMLYILFYKFHAFFSSGQVLKC